MALEEAASEMSLSLMAPTPPWMQRTRTSSLESFSSEERTASTEPWTSALTMRLRSLISPSCIWLKRSSSVVFCRDLSWESLILSRRSSATWRASLSSGVTWRMSPASGTSLKPMISTGVEGPASWMRSPLSLTMARTRP